MGRKIETKSTFSHELNKITMSFPDELFSIGLEFQCDLDNGEHGSENLCKEFEDNGRPLSRNATIWRVKRGSRWLIADRDNERRYTVRLKERQLAVYPGEFFFHCQSQEDFAYDFCHNLPKMSAQLGINIDEKFIAEHFLNQLEINVGEAEPRIVKARIANLIAASLTYRIRIRLSQLLTELTAIRKNIARRSTKILARIVKMQLTSFDVTFTDQKVVFTFDENNDEIIVVHTAPDGFLNDFLSACSFDPKALRYIIEDLWKVLADEQYARPDRYMLATNFINAFQLQETHQLRDEYQYEYLRWYKKVRIVIE